MHPQILGGYLRWLGSLALSMAPAIGLSQTVIEVPPAELTDFFVVADGQTLNLRSGGNISGTLTAADGSFVNVFGGGLSSLRAAGGVVTIAGGEVERLEFRPYLYDPDESGFVEVRGGLVNSFSAPAGSHGRISGGVFGRAFTVESGSSLELVGGEFRLNGVEYLGDQLTLNDRLSRDVFTGTLSDGSPIVLTPLYGGGQFGDSISELALTTAPLPPADLTPITVDGAVTEPPRGLRSGQVAAVQPGGSLGRNFAVVEGDLLVEGGVVGDGLEVVGGRVSISDGEIGSFFNAYAGSSVSISGGAVGFRFEATDSNIEITGGQITSSFEMHSGTTADISGGNVGSLLAHEGSAVSIRGGTIGFGGNIYGGLSAFSGSRVSIAGGTVGRLLTAADSEVEIVGGDFRLNGSPIHDGPVVLSGDSTITGVFADGSSFLFSGRFGDSLDGVTFFSVEIPAADLTSRVVDRPLVDQPAGLRPGQQLTLRAGGVLPDNFAVVDASLRVEAGQTGRRVKAIDSEVAITGGQVGSGLVVADSTVSLTGGEIGERSAIYAGGILNMTGGVIGSKLRILNGGKFSLAGGAVGPDFQALAGSDVQIIGGDFKLNGEDYTGDVITLGDRGGPAQLFTGTLSDGSPFLFSPQVNPLGDELEGVRLVRTPLPPIDMAPRVVASPQSSGPIGLRPGQTMTIVDGGELQDNFTAIGATLNVTGGRVGDFSRVLDSTVRISGGEVGGWFQAYNSEVEIVGGEVGVQLAAFAGTRTLIDSASVRGLRVYSDASAVITGGSKIEFSVQVLGGDFELNDGVIGGSLSGSGRWSITGGTIEQTFQIGNGQAEISGGAFESFLFANSSRLSIRAGLFKGRVSSNRDSIFDISDGEFLDDVWSRSTKMTVAGGQFQGDITNGNGSFLGQSGTMLITGGTFLGDFLNSSGTATISGGDFAGELSNGSDRSRDLSTLNLSGGLFRGSLVALPGSVVNLIGSEFYLDGVLLDLVEGVSTEIADRDMRLTGRLSNGSPFSFDLLSSRTPGQDFFSPAATLTLTFVPIPEPVSGGLAVLSSTVWLIACRRIRV